MANYFLYRLVTQRNSWQETRSTGFLVLTTVGSSGSTSLQLLAISLHPSLGHLILPWVGPAGAAGMAGFLLFAYYFHPPSGLGKWGGIVLAVLLAALVCLELLIAVDRWVLVREGVVEFREAWVDIPFAAAFGLSFLFFIAHLARAIARQRHKPLWIALLFAVGAIVWPRVKLTGDAAAARAFFYVSAMPLLLAVSLLLRSYGVIDWLWAEVLACWLFLFAVAGFVLAYLNYVPEQSSFRIKVIGITMVTVLSILCGISWVFGAVYIDGYKNPHLPQDQTAIQFVPDPDGGYLVAPAEYRFHSDLGDKIADGEVVLPEAFQFFGAIYRSAFVSRDGVVGFEQMPLWRDFDNRFGPQPVIYALTTSLVAPEVGQGTAPGGLFYKENPDHVAFTWNNMTSAYRLHDRYSFQLRLYYDGDIELVFKDVPQRVSPDVYRADVTPMMIGIVPGFEGRRMSEIRFSENLPHQTAQNQGVIDYHRLDFLTYLDRIYGPIALFILIASLIILIILPRFFRINLDLPLKRLISSVQQIMDGKLSTEVGVSHRDEIGFLATSFRKMAVAQQDLIASLEDKVVKRTSEVTEYAVKNARLEERNRLSWDLHDAVSQTLFSANLIASNLPDLLQKDPERGIGALADIQRLNKKALAEMRQMLLYLREDKRAQTPMGLLLQKLVGEIEGKFPVDISLQIDGDAVLPEVVQLNFYRIAQESMTNATKHAGAGRVDVLFDGMAKKAMLTVRDDGKGFDTSIRKSGHMGLQIMRERIADVGGTLDIVSAPGAGCQVTAIWYDPTEDDQTPAQIPL